MKKWEYLFDIEVRFHSLKERLGTNPCLQSLYKPTKLRCNRRVRVRGVPLLIDPLTSSFCNLLRVPQLACTCRAIVT